MSNNRKRLFLFVGIGFLAVTAAVFADGWPQWGQNPQHQGFVGVAGHRYVAIGVTYRKLK